MIFNLGWTPRGAASPHVCFAEPSAASARSEVALAGRDGQRAADLLAASKSRGAAVLAEITERAVRRLLALAAATGTVPAAPVLFDDAELRELQDAFQATIATADLLGRSRVRRFAARMAEREKEGDTAKFAESPADFVALLNQVLASVPKAHGNTSFISHVYEGMRAKFPDLTRAEFDRQLIDAHRARLITLSRLDLPQGIDPALIRQSQVNFLSGEFHLIEPGRRTGGEPASAPPSPPAVTPASPPASSDPPATPPRRGTRLGPDDDPFSPFPEPIPFQRPDEAVRYFRNLVPTLGDDPFRYGALLERHAFTLAVATDQTMLDKVKKIIADRLEGATGPAGRIGTATADIQDVLNAAGVSPENPQYAEQVFRTNMLDSMNHGQMAELQTPEMQEFFPVWQYMGIRDGRQGKDHEPKFDKYYPVSAAFADVRGPRIFNCRCSILPLHKSAWAELQARGARLESRW